MRRQGFNIPLQLAVAFTLLLFGCTTLAIGSAGHTHEVQPIRSFINVGEGQRDGVISIRNTRNHSLPIEMVVFRRIVAEDGTQTLERADDDFLVFPPQMVVPEGASQAVRYQYLGDPDIAESIAYVIEAQEVPVVPEGFSGITTVYNVGAAVYVQPARPQAQLAISNVRRDGDIVRFEVRNSGNDYSFLTLNQMELRFADEAFALEPEVVNAIIANPIVPPNSLRRFEMDVSAYPDGVPEIRFGRF